MLETNEKCGYCADTGWSMRSKPGPTIDGVLHMITFPQICLACTAGKRESEKIRQYQQDTRE